VFFPLATFLASTSQRAQMISFAAMALFVSSLGGLMYSVGLPVISALPWDMAIQLDGAWRIVHGQIPSIDFRSVIPPLTLELSALGISLGSPSAACIAYGNLLLFLMLTPWAWVIARRRLSAAYACLFAAFVGAIVLTPRPLGDKIGATSYAMLYNRQGWAITSVILLSLLVPVLPTVSKRPILGGLGNGVLLALLAFSKLSFFAVAAAAIVLNAVVDRLSWLSLMLGVVVGYLSTVIVLGAATGLDFNAYLGETAAIAQAYIPGKSRDVIGITLKNLDQIFIIVALSLLCLRKAIPEDQQADLWRKGRLLIGIAFMVGAGVLLTATSAQRIDIPLFAVAGLLCVEWLRRTCPTKPVTGDLITGGGYLFGAIILVPLLIGPLLGKDAAAIMNASVLHVSQKASAAGTQTFQSRTLQDFVIAGDRSVISDIAPNQPAVVYPGQINDGMRLLRKYVTQRSRIMTMDFSNPFPFALELPPTQGGATCWLVEASFSKAAHPGPEAAFGDANLIMIPSYERNANTVAALKAIYGDYLRRNYRLIDRTEIWELYERRAQVQDGRRAHALTLQGADDGGSSAWSALDPRIQQASGRQRSAY